MVAAIARRIAIIIAITITLDINPITPFTMIVKIIAKAHTNIAGIKSNIEGIIYKKKSITDAIVKRISNTTRSIIILWYILLKQL